MLLCALMLGAPGALAAKLKPAPGHSFAVIGHSFDVGGIEARLEQALAISAGQHNAFVVATGIKGNDEPCADRLYLHRRDMFDQADSAVIVAPAASDWSECKNSRGRSQAIERLNRLRELFYPEPLTLGRRTLELSRLSASAKFRSYAENAHWSVGKVLYATVNMPVNNNNYRQEAGRNSEFEDRAVANRFWLNRLFAQARRKKLDALVLFSEGDVRVLLEPPSLFERLGRGDSGHDGFAETRKQIQHHAGKFDGKVLLINTAKPADGAKPKIVWRGNLGHVSAGSQLLRVRVQDRASDQTEELFRLEQP
jgi:hypothetical protein